ncbi:14196_t:CDS:1, partial [Gigaspora rosea]
HSQIQTGVFFIDPFLDSITLLHTNNSFLQLHQAQNSPFFHHSKSWAFNS